jgi:hypothetical protein
MVPRGLKKRLWRIVAVVWIMEGATRLMMMMVSILTKGMVDGSLGYTGGVAVESLEVLVGFVGCCGRGSLHWQQEFDGLIYRVQHG